MPWRRRFSGSKWQSKRKARVAYTLAGLFLLAAVADSGRFLVVDQPRKSDVIVVLAGETERRPARGLELLNQGYARRLVLDVPAVTKIYQWRQTELAERYVQGLSQANLITICPIHGLSTREEAGEAAICLDRVGGRSVLLVTSDYHTRRALSIFSREAPNHDYSVKATFDPGEFGIAWWRHREWAKTNVYEWVRLAWWEMVDRWR